jgi:hypothetical protein
MKKHLDKIICAFAIALLITSVAWWIKWNRREINVPVERKLMDSIDNHMKQAEKHANIARKYVQQAEEYAKVYHDPNIDSTERSRIGAEIWANAVRKADSLRKCAAR